MILMIDNYDSFTYNLVHYFGQLGHLPMVIKNDELNIEAIEKLSPQAIIISPGPCNPDKAGISCQAIEHFAKKKLPILGVCLGMQAIVQVFNGKISHAPSIMHGRASEIFHQGEDIFQSIPSPYKAIRYHSLAVKGELPQQLKLLAQTKDRVVMAVKHRSLPIYGVQFHPESILTQYGLLLLENFLKITNIFKKS